ncbi:hypothetical protein OROMI_029867 [Orobanche minor]
MWIRHHDELDRCYLYDMSCGTTIISKADRHMLEMKPIVLRYKKRTNIKLNLATDLYFPLPVHDVISELALPVMTEQNHPFCNPFIDGPMKEQVNLGLVEQEFVKVIASGCR